MSAFFLRDIAGPRISPVVLASPHSGTEYPDEFLRDAMPGRHALMRAEDRLVDRLVMPVAEAHDLPLLSARWGRTYIDLNRAPEELDSAILDGAPRALRSDRVRAGLGVLPRIATPGVPIYRRPLPLSEAHRRIAEVHEPYHRQLGALLARARAANGFAILIDCHSMPPLPRRAGRRGAEAVLGDRHGDSCDRRFSKSMETALSRHFRTARNTPYAGGYATAYFGEPNMAAHALQIEIDRSLYLDMTSLMPGPGFARVSAALGEGISLFLEDLHRAGDHRLAAE
ncbi:N-formylglutamate amidohydrolase [Pacificimonas sp. WHA3]|uniref:N-formylglutamate amidohydrolase n=1 Tax=Pacificimonas pallii TaxID=2827236 RepID=A0ABS6SEZ4_9SPHN|nr:N-formylglutamate amidohydrolase [Pacificimonas pallii]MBV7256511.1 N-formylglutamate amidohydrolase [Pacificimonas pallii]